MHDSAKISRRAFIRNSVFGVGGFALSRWMPSAGPSNLVEFPKSDKLGRVCVGKIEVKASPAFESKTAKILYQDAVLPWIKEVIGAPNLNRGKSRRWVETPDGYIYAPDLQLVRNIQNDPLKALPQGSGAPGFWAEVTVPYVEGILVDPPAKAIVLKDLDVLPRLYYSQVYWIDGMRSRNNLTEYRVTEKHGSPGDMFWSDARAFRTLSEKDLAPIHPEVENKKVLINVSKQTLTCYEGKREVYFCRISSGAKFNADGKAVDSWSTPLGMFQSISRKYISIHMAGGTRASGYEVFGIGWTSFFATGGFAIHSTYWHSNYGEPMSHGCINVLPEDSKWVFLWSAPQVPYDPGKIEISGYDGTKVEVIEE
jgi:hypothetical protein